MKSKNELAETPRIFVSYSHDSEAHKRWVRKLSGDLRERGIDAILDVWDLRPGDDAASFMERGVREADRVLLVCSEAYVQKANEMSGGVGYEKLVITGELARDLSTTKFVPIVRRSGEDTKLPSFLGNRIYISFEDDDRYSEQLEELVREIHDAPRYLKPPLGPNPFESAKTLKWLAHRPPRNMSEATEVARLGEEAVPYLDWHKQYKAHEASACVRALGLIGGGQALTALGTYRGDLRKSVFRELLTTSGEFEDSDLQGVFSSLNIEHLGIDNVGSLAGLQHAASLRQLSIVSCPKVRDLEPLSHLRNLQDLYIYYHWRGSDLGPLSNLPSLSSLSFGNCSSVRDVAPISSLTRLKTLGFWTCWQLSDISPLSTLTRLENIAFSHCSITSIAALESMGNLRQVHLSSCENVSDLSVLSTLEDLEHLYLGQRFKKMVPQDVRDQVEIKYDRAINS